MQKWQYCEVGYHPGGMYTWRYAGLGSPEGDMVQDKASRLHDTIMKLGLDGWELVAVVHDPNGEVYYFKRPL